MKRAASLRIASGLAGAVLLMAAGTGCTSYRIATTLQPTGQPIPAPESVRFNLAEVQFVSPTNMPESGFAPFQFMSYFDDALRTNLMAAAMAAYPGTFSTDEGAVPLSVVITHVENRSEASEGFLCASCLTLTILPLHTIEHYDYSVSVTSGKEAVDAVLSRPMGFTRSDNGWLSFFPTGWIPVPASKGVRAWGTDSAIRKVQDASLNGVVEAIAIRLRQVNPDDWR